MSDPNEHMCICSCTKCFCVINNTYSVLSCIHVLLVFSTFNIFPFFLYWKSFCLLISILFFSHLHVIQVNILFTYCTCVRTHISKCKRFMSIGKSLCPYSLTIFYLLNISSGCFLIVFVYLFLLHNINLELMP